MRVYYGYICVTTAIVFWGCSKGGSYVNSAKTADSLSGAVNYLIKNLEKTDTLLLQRAIARYRDYSLFLRQNLNDTIEKTEADNLQHFYAGGSCIENFSRNRNLILSRARLVDSQLKKLSEDLQTNPPEADAARIYIMQEKDEAGKLLETGNAQQRKFQAAFEEFKNSLAGVESLIRSRNRGELPTIIKDSTNL